MVPLKASMFTYLSPIFQALVRPTEPWRRLHGIGHLVMAGDLLGLTRCARNETGASTTVGNLPRFLQGFLTAVTIDAYDHLFVAAT
jgi:hypothetical protein